MIIAIASRSRWTIINKLLRQFHPYLLPRTILFVPESQHTQYLREICSVPEHSIVEVQTVPDDWVLAPIRVHMAKVARDRWFSTIIMVDDDLRLERRREDTSTRTMVSTPEDVWNMFQTLQHLLEDGTWGHVAIGPRLMQQNRPIGGPSQVVEQNKRAMCIVGWRLDDFFAIDYGRMKARSDFDGTLQSLRKGRPNLVIGYWFCGQDPSVSLKGGCHDYRTAEMYDETAHQLAAHHPGLVRIVHKKHKMGVVNERTEVQISWLQAFDYDKRMKVGGV